VKAALIAAAVFVAGCGGGAENDHASPKPAPQNAEAEAVIRGWTEALYRGEYERAANYFAPRAIVQQGRSFVLKTHDEAVFFGKTLPCRAKVTSIKAEPKKGTLLASFELFAGFAGTCSEGGTAKVRFYIRNGKIETWRQLRTPPTAPGQNA
jgi:hypothetical protein